VTVSRRLRVLVHAPHLSGVGHHVRMREVARALARHHQVGFFTGGRPVPGDWPAEVELLPLPGLVRDGQGLRGLAAGADLAATLLARQAAIRAVALHWQADLVVIEHYPFSKWELAPEFEVLMTVARAANAGVRIACSVRDIPRQTRHEACSAAEWSTRVVEVLNTRFDALLVHGEAALTPLGEHFPGVALLHRQPVHTGLVSEPLPPGNAGQEPGASRGGKPFVLASIGGGADDAGLLACCREAWLQLLEDGRTGGRHLVLVHGLAGGAAHGAAAGTGITSVPFSAHFLAWLRAADLSISHAGYNTCANLLATRARAIIVPNPRMSDQAARAAVLQSLGVATVLPAAGLAPGPLADALCAALERPRPVHALRLDGATRAAEFLAQLAA
jgi:predicted glycosyltransferase